MLYVYFRWNKLFFQLFFDKYDASRDKVEYFLLLLKI